MNVRLALVAALALPLGLSAMPTAVEYLPSTITLNQDVKLGNSVLKAGSYEVQIHYKGFGSSAELQFFQNRVFKGKTNAEARGFPSTAPGAADPNAGKLQKISPELKIEDQTAHKDQSSYKLQKADYKEQKADTPDALQSFSWGTHGFAPGATGNALQTGGSVKLSFNSSNSAAGFSATLPLAK